jgi:formiminotetrahydrofolate cyclodeaminase
MSFQKLSIEEYQALLESKKSTPSGGSALALTLETAASLCLMVCNLTVNKKGYEEIKDKIIEMINEITLIKEEAKKLMDDDSIAFDRLMNAFKEKNETLIEECAIESAIVPYRLYNETKKLQAYAEVLKEIGNKSVQSDAIIAIDLSKAIYHGSILNIKANLPFIKNEKVIEKLNSILD